MCPACIAAAALIAIGATGAGGLTAFAVSTLGKKRVAPTIPVQSESKEDRHG